MNFPINSKKATQAVARLIERSGGPIDYLRLMKLIYVSDRESIISRGVPIVGGTYYSMRRGPVIGEVMGFVGSRKAPDWESLISLRYGNEIRLENKPLNGALSQAEMDILDANVLKHVSRTTDELVDWCHDNCPEYELVHGNDRKPIYVETILKSAGKKKNEIQEFVAEAKSMAALDMLLA